MKRMKSFLLGAAEFKSRFTTHCDRHQDAYDWGREWAHRLTLRRFEEV